MLSQVQIFGALLFFSEIKQHGKVQKQREVQTVDINAGRVEVL